jgi:putative toxin-antitoxin system antitoxin component (TIGR02293 family)
MKKPKKLDRRAPGPRAKSRRAGRSSRREGEPAAVGFHSPAAVYDHGEAVIADSLPAEAHEGAPVARVMAPALRSLEAHGYSQDEIFALVVPRRTFARRLKRREPLTIEETDRAIRLARVAELAEQTFGDKAKAHRWLRKPKRALGRATPLAYLASEAGARLVEEMLYRIDSGVLS